MSTAVQPEVLDLRHFTAAQLAPLLRDEAARWQRRLSWDYTQATNILLDYLDGRILPGFVALDPDSRLLLGYAFCVFEGAKAVIGDIYAFGETETPTNPIGDTLLRHMLEMLQATPGVDRIESQLLMYPAGALATPFREHHFRSYPRLFMTSDLTTDPDAPRSDSGTWAKPPSVSPLPLDLFRLHNLTLHTWHPTFYDAAASLIHRCYTGHMDAAINDQYRTYAGAQRFLHNIIRFPGCGLFDAPNSFALRDARTSEMLALLLTSRIRDDIGHITQLCVSPTLRGRGIGQALLRHCATHSAGIGLTSLSLTVTEANSIARQLYRANGFTTIHRFDAMVWDKHPPTITNF